MPQSAVFADLLIIGAGISGLTAALDYLRKPENQHKIVRIVDSQPPSEIGGLARYAFGGMALIDTPEQRRMKIKDSSELALKDWMSFAEFGDVEESSADYWPYQWAKFYCENVTTQVYDFVRHLDLRFLPAVNWVERGQYHAGNSVPRYHMLWGTSLRLVTQIVDALKPFEGKQLHYHFCHRVTDLLSVENTIDNHNAAKRSENNSTVIGCEGFIREPNDTTTLQATELPEKCQSYFRVEAPITVIAAGGFSGNNDRVRQYSWQAPEQFLNGTHPASDGHLHDCSATLGAQLHRMGDMWNYAAGIEHPQPLFPSHGLSLVPCKSALWLDARGKRIGPEPLVTGFDTHWLCQRMAEQSEGYAWHVLNWHIAKHEFAISGAEHNQAIRDRNIVKFIKNTLFGNDELLHQMQRESEDFIVADSLELLVKGMNSRTGNQRININSLQHLVSEWDQQISQGARFWNDDQLRRIEQARKWRPDKLRTCLPEPLLKTSHGPLIAIRVQYITRKNLGGIQTNLHSQVLAAGKPIQGLYAIGEAAGFGGGGANGKRSLEGTFLSGCILTARQAVAHINQT